MSGSLRFISSSEKKFFAAAFPLIVCSSAYGGIENLPALSKCLHGRGSVTVTANTSWQSINAVNLQRREGTACTISIVYPAAVSGPALPTELQPPLLLLLRINTVELVPPSQPCNGLASHIVLYGPDATNASDYLCSTSTVTYVWSSSNIAIYNMQFQSSGNASFAAAFKITSATNLCNMNGSELFVDSEVYVFAPDERYAMIPPNGNNLCRTGFNHTLSIIPANSSWALVITVLAAPWTNSCRVLCINGECLSGNASHSMAVRNVVNIRYHSRPCNGSNSATKAFDGFTLTAAIEIQILTSSANRVTGDSAVVSVLYTSSVAATWLTLPNGKGKGTDVASSLLKLLISVALAFLAVQQA